MHRLFRSPGRLVFTPLLVSLLIWSAAGAAPVDEIYYQGTEAFRGGDLKTALARFDAVRQQIGSDHALFAPIHYNLGRCAELMDDRGMDDAPVCEGVGWFDVFLANADPKRSARALQRARAGRAKLVERCAAKKKAAEPPPEPAPPELWSVPPEPADNTRWWLAGGAAAAGVVGVVALALAGDSDADADLAFESYESAETASEAERWKTLVREAESEARGRSIVGLLGVGAAIGLGVTALVWEDDEPTAGPRAFVGPTGFGLAW